jgi:LDH2 family malate/lactate/ureidoglycolate dehydrogenase
MTGSAKLPGVGEIRMPGTNSWRIYQDRKANGIPITAPLLDKLNAAADEVGVARLV